MDLLLSGIARRYGYDFRDYARPSLIRRLRLAQHREGAATISSLLDRVLHDAQAMTRVVEAVSVHTTTMFRDADFYLALREHVLPVLRTYPFIRIWHAGCATGEEVYSLGILLHEEGLADRCRVYATDMSEAVLDRARKGVYSLKSIRDYTIAYQRAGGREDFSSYYTADAHNAVFRQSLRSNVVFSQHNLATDGAFNEFHLVLCRNVMIYFEDRLRDRAHGLIHSSLGKFGMLGLGKKETVRFTPYENLYQELPSAVRLYRRNA